MESAFGRWAAGDKRPNTAVSLNRRVNNNDINSSPSLLLCEVAEKDWNQAEKQCNATFDTLVTVAVSRGRYVKRRTKEEGVTRQACSCRCSLFGQDANVNRPGQPHQPFLKLPPLSIALCMGVTSIRYPINHRRSGHFYAPPDPILRVGSSLLANKEGELRLIQTCMCRKQALLKLEPGTCMYLHSYLSRPRTALYLLRVLTFVTTRRLPW
jgi:hypothetical protein